MCVRESVFLLSISQHHRYGSHHKHQEDKKPPDDQDARISDLNVVESYNWVDEITAKILVLGKQASIYREKGFKETPCMAA